MDWFFRLLPDRLMARVYGLYALTLIAFIGAGLALFFQARWAAELDSAHDNGAMVLELAVHSVADSAMNGDHATLKRLLDSAVEHSLFSSAHYIALNGSSINASNSLAGLNEPPAWLRERVARQLQAVSRPVSVAGRDYGVLRLGFNANHIAQRLWQVVLSALMLGGACLVGGLLCIWFPIKHWLGPLRHAGRASTAPGPADGSLDPDSIRHAPKEIRHAVQTLRSLAQTTSSLSSELVVSQDALRALRAIVANNLPDGAANASDSDDVDALVVTVGNVVRELDTAHQQVLLAKNEADAANQTKSLFLANMSHEIRTPIHAVLGLCELTLGSELNAFQRRHVEMIAKAGESLLAVVDDILNFSKVEVGGLTLECREFALEPVLQRAASVVAAKALAKGLALSLDIGPQVPPVLHSDPYLLSQILHHALNNAVKFTASGHLEIKVRQLSVAGDRVQLKVSVNDTGIGLLGAQRQHLFQPFMQADNSATRRYGGTGLGLSIAKRLGDLLGGELDLDNRAGGGATFSLVFWAQVEQVQSPQAQSRPASAPQVAGMRVLLVDDNDINRLVLRALLVRGGAVVTTAVNGQEAVDLLLTTPEPLPWDVVLMDVQMPVLDGLAATRLIRAVPRFKDLPILALTAHAQPEAAQRCLASGMNAHLSKPIQVTTLYTALVHWCGWAQTNRNSYG